MSYAAVRHNGKSHRPRNARDLDTLPRVIRSNRKGRNRKQQKTTANRGEQIGKACNAIIAITKNHFGDFIKGRQTDVINQLAERLRRIDKRTLATAFRQLVDKGILAWKDRPGGYALNIL